jgi:hypothetical protein
MDGGDMHERVIPDVRPNLSGGNFRVGDTGHTLPTQIQLQTMQLDNRGQRFYERRGFAGPCSGNHDKALALRGREAFPKRDIRLRVWLIDAATH